MGFREPDLLDYLSRDESAFGSDYETVRRYQDLEGKRIAAGNPDSVATTDALRNREADLRSSGSLRHNLLAWLGRTPYPSLAGASPPQTSFVAEFTTRFTTHFEAAYEADVAILASTRAFDAELPSGLLPAAMKKLKLFLAKPERCAILFILQFAQQPRLAAPADLLEAILEVDEAFLNWRDRHIQMVARVIGGGRMSTMGAVDSGLGYLRETTSKRAFPEVWDARSFLLGHAEAEGMYEGQPGAWGMWQHYRLAFEVLQ